VIPVGRDRDDAARESADLHRSQRRAGRPVTDLADVVGPQHSTAPSSVRAHACSPPATTSTTTGAPSSAAVAGATVPETSPPTTRARVTPPIRTTPPLLDPSTLRERVVPAKGREARHAGTVEACVGSPNPWGYLSPGARSDGSGCGGWRTRPPGAGHHDRARRPRGGVGDGASTLREATMWRGRSLAPPEAFPQAGIRQRLWSPVTYRACRRPVATPLGSTWFKRRTDHSLPAFE